MKANKKAKEADERAVSAVIGVILMVAITVAIAATVYVYVSGMIGGTKNQTPNIACVTDSTTNKITVATADANVKWSDIVLTRDTTATYFVYTGGGVTAQACNKTSLIAANTVITAGDYILLQYNTTGVTSNVKVTLRYIPTNSLLGSWTINV